MAICAPWHSTIAPCIVLISDIPVTTMPSRYTTHMDVGNADFAWSKNLPFVGNCSMHYSNTSHPCDYPEHKKRTRRCVKGHTFKIVFRTYS
jgi:hypothetical protein